MLNVGWNAAVMATSDSMRDDAKITAMGKTVDVGYRRWRLVVMLLFAPQGRMGCSRFNRQPIYYFMVSYDLLFPLLFSFFFMAFCFYL